MRFIVFSDSKGKEDGINKAVLKKIMMQSCKLIPKPEFITVCGDSVAGSRDEKILTSQLQDFRNLIQKYHSNKLLIPVVGNHEVNREEIDDRYEKIFTQVYSDLNPDGFLQDYNKTVYFFDFEDTRLIVLNAFHYNAIHKIGKEQLAWFEKTASVDKKNKIVFVHSPAFPTGAHLGHCLDLHPEYRDAFWQAAENCCIDIVISGHEHNYSRRLISPHFSNTENKGRNGIYQIITGGGGEKLKDKFTSKEGVVIAPIGTYHFLVVDVMEQGIKISAIDLRGKGLDEFTIYK